MPSGQTKPVKSTPASTQDGKFDIGDWPKIVQTVKSEAASLYTALRLAVPSLDGDKLTLAFQFPLHQKKISSPKATDLIGQLIEDASGAKLHIESVVDKSLQKVDDPVKATTTAPEDPAMATISNIFGGGEVVES